MLPSFKLSRRAFLAASVVLAPAALAQPGRPRANDRVVTGHIGVGARGRALLTRLRGSAAAVCDVDEDHLADGAALVGAGVRVYRDYRELLEQSDIDAVVIATPDHWHALQTVHACEAGKDVYVETPACRVFEEGRAMVRAATWYGRVVHAGATGPHAQAVAAVRAHLQGGASGTVQGVACWGVANLEGGNPAKNAQAPQTLDWDRWLGPNRWRPYNPDCAHGNWRRLLDFGGGNVCQQGAQLLHVADDLLDLPATGTVTVSATGARPASGLWDCPTTLETTWSFSATGLTIHWQQPGPDDAAPAGLSVEGTSDTLRLSWRGDQWRLEAPPQPAEEESEDADPLMVWLEAVRNGDASGGGLATACRAAALAALANAAWRLGRSVTCDLETGGCAGDWQAERLLRAPGRGAYRL